MLALLLAAAVVAHVVDKDDLFCATETSRKVLKQDISEKDRAAIWAAHMFFMGRLSAEEPSINWSDRVIDERSRYLAIPPTGTVLNPNNDFCVLRLRKLMWLSSKSS